MITRGSRETEQTRVSYRLGGEKEKEGEIEREREKMRENETATVLKFECVEGEGGGERKSSMDRLKLRQRCILYIVVPRSSKT